LNSCFPIVFAQAPKLQFSTYVGRPKHQLAMVNTELDADFFIGDAARKLRGVLKLNHPMRHGVVTDWPDMQALWTYAYQQLNVAQEEHPVLITEAPLNPRKNRGKTAEIFFEGFSVPALYVAAQAILSLYASGRTTGLVLDSGDGVTQAVPVFEGTKSYLMPLKRFVILFFFFFL
jgi:centractin